MRLPRFDLRQLMVAALVAVIIPLDAVLVVRQINITNRAAFLIPAVFACLFGLASMRHPWVTLGFLVAANLLVPNLYGYCNPYSFLASGFTAGWIVGAPAGWVSRSSSYRLRLKAIRFPRVRFTVRRMMVVVAVLAVFVNYIAVPVWDYYHIPPKTRAVLTMLGQPIRLTSSGPMPLVVVLKSIKAGTQGAANSGIPIYVDPVGLADAGARVESTIVATTDPMTAKEQLDRSLVPLGLGYFVKDGLLTITSAKEAGLALKRHPKEARRP